MSALERLRDPQTSLSVAWKAAEALLGRGIKVWEPETLHLELERRGVPWDGGLDAKLLAAQTVLTTRAWTHDHDVFFAVAMACDGHGAGDVAHPTVLQLAWAVREIEALTEGTIDEDAGFDPDGVDPAIAGVLHDDGWILAPDALAFVQGTLVDLSHSDPALLAKVSALWERLRGKPSDALASLLARAPEDPIGVQIARLADCEIELRARAQRRLEQLRELGT